MIQLKILLIAVAVAAVVGAAGGWTANGWRLGGRIAELQGVVDTQKQSIDTLAGANQRCTAGLEDVKGAVKGYVDAGIRRSAEAKAAMERAEAAAVGHLAAAKEALGRPLPAPGGECEALAREAESYARRRKAAP